MKLHPTVLTIAEIIERNNGRAYLVGGMVHDYLWGILHPSDKRVNDDVDVEVFGIEDSLLKTILTKFGKVVESGKDFGVYNLRPYDTNPSYEYQFALSRREVPMTSEQRQEWERDHQRELSDHHAFIVTPDPSVSTVEASSRRVTNVKACMWRITTGELIDHWNALQGLQDSLFDVISQTVFPQDPVRVLLCASYMARYSPMIPTIRLQKASKGVVDRFPYITKERVWKEFYKIFKYQYPSRGLRFLDDVGWIDCFPQISAMKETPQDAEWHPEGDLWEHSLLSADHAAKAVRELYSEDHWKVPAIVFAGFMHDIGKPITTVHCDDGHIRSLEHNKVGVDVLNLFFDDLHMKDTKIRTFVGHLVREHMMPMLVPENAKLGRILTRLYRRIEGSDITLRDLGVVCESDHSSRPPLPGGMPKRFQEFLEYEESLKNQDDDLPKPFITGKTIMNIGVPQGPTIGIIKNAALEAQYSGEFTTEEGALEWLESYKSEYF